MKESGWGIILPALDGVGVIKQPMQPAYARLNFFSSSARDGSTRTAPSGKMMVGTLLKPLLMRSTSAAAPASAAISTHFIGHAQLLED
ncbi:hypothetical protein [Dehalogenimonas alkenigignens]|uniref:hypothetical protein n=1 Tax=Dehalogenimonas alkenigignens TaxID=1217799 RepID=UPI001F0C52A3|nr:hypothetical protein [Dehalogenimonas alkenigignens]